MYEIVKKKIEIKKVSLFDVDSASEKNSNGNATKDFDISDPQERASRSICWDASTMDAAELMQVLDTNLVGNPPSQGAQRNLSLRPPARVMADSLLGSGGCTAHALSALGLFGTKSEAQEALNKEIQSVLAKERNKNPNYPEAKVGIINEQWCSEVVKNAIIAQQYHLTKLKIEITDLKQTLKSGTYLIDGVLNNSYVKRVQGKLKTFKTDPGDIGPGPAQDETRWRHAIAIKDGTILEQQDQRLSISWLWLNENSIPDLSKGYMRKILKVYRITSCTGDGCLCKGRALKRKRNLPHEYPKCQEITHANKPPLELLYWANADNGLPAISEEVWRECIVVTFSKKEWSTKQQILKGVCEPIQVFAKVENQNKRACAKYQMKEVQWQSYDYNKDVLMQKGFALSNEKTLVAVEDGAGRFAVKYVYWPTDEPQSPMDQLAEYIYDGKGRVLRKARGLSEFGARGGGKTERGSMVMFGSHNFIPGKTHKEQGILKAIPTAYRFNDNLDQHMNAALCDHVNNLTRLEKMMIPALAKARDDLALDHDPDRLHRMSNECTAFAASLASSYVVTAHDDSGKASETIQFTNRFGPLPPNHSWDFAVGGHVHALPNEKGKAVLLFVEGEGVLHGTLPTSSTEPTLDHGNHGSALVTKKHTIDSMIRQRAGADTTPPHMTASKVFLD
jgi:hypothetical protein